MIPEHYTTQCCSGCGNLWRSICSSKTYNCKKENTPLKINGSGKAMRQFVNVNDLSRIIYKFIYLDVNSMYDLIQTFLEEGMFGDIYRK